MAAIRYVQPLLHRNIYRSFRLLMSVEMFRHFSPVYTPCNPCVNCMFPCRADYIFIQNGAGRLVVEPSAFRRSVADCPIRFLFNLSRSGLFHPHAVELSAIRVFQQFPRYFLEWVSPSAPLNWLIHKYSHILLR